MQNKNWICDDADDWIPLSFVSIRPISVTKEQGIILVSLDGTGERWNDLFSSIIAYVLVYIIALNTCMSDRSVLLCRILHSNTLIRFPDTEKVNKD